MDEAPDILKLWPTTYRLRIGDSPPLHLWRTAENLLVLAKGEILGDKFPAIPATGKVRLGWGKIELMGYLPQEPPEFIQVKPYIGQLRDLVVIADDGLQEVRRTLVVYKPMELA